MPDSTEVEIEFGNNGEIRNGVSLHIPIRHKNSFGGDSDFLTGVRIFEDIGDARKMVGVTIEVGALAAFVENKPHLTALHRDRNGTPRILDTDFAAADPQLASVDMFPFFGQTNVWSIIVDRIGRSVLPRVQGSINFKTGDIQYQTRE